MASANATTDHDQIRQWVEERGGHPAHVKRTDGKNDPGVLRIDYPDFSGGDTLERISWDKWFRSFDKNNLAFLYQKGRSRFSKLVDRSSVKAKSVKASSGRRAASGKKARSKKASSTRTKKAASRKATSSRKRTTSARTARAATKSTARRRSTSTSTRSRSTTANGRTRRSAKRTTDHDEIRRWVEARGGWPATVKRTVRRGDEAGLLRIDYPGYSGARSLERIDWDEFFDMFDRKKLAFLYQDVPNSRFSKLVSR